MKPEDTRLADLHIQNQRRMHFRLSALCTLALFVCAIITLFSAPVTWNEIFLTASLKDISTFPSMPAGALLIPEANAPITIPKPLHYAPWLTSTVGSLSSALSALPSLTAIFIQTPKILALRLFTLLLALLAAPVLLQGIVLGADTETNSQKTFAPRSPLETTALCALVLFFARIGGVEQLLVILALSLLWWQPTRFTAGFTKPWHKRIQILVSAMLLALSHSQTWIYSICSASLIFFFLNRHALLWFKQHFIWFVAGCGVIFAFLFPALSSYEGLVHSFTVRWLYEYNMRQSLWGWPGSSVVFRLLSFYLMILALRRGLATFRETKGNGTPEQFMICLSFAAGIFLAFQQINPTFEDFLLHLALFYFSKHVRHKSSPPTASPQFKPSPRLDRLLRTADTFLLGIFPATTVVLASLCIFLFISPSANVLREIQVWLSTLQQAFAASKIELSMYATVSLAVLTLLFRAKIAQKSRPAISVLMAVVFLHLGSVVRSHCIWKPYSRLVQAIPDTHTFLYLPPLAPFVALQTSKHMKHMAVPVQTGDAGAPLDGTVVLVLPSHISDLCQAMNWNLAETHGIFAVCTLGRDSLWKMVLLN
ncbi:MAG: hypothetical protein FJY29_05225 [Betaproteobacteria bacterium]|nr:hypothetical protein [Betaproteobacteria bacterium]